MVIDIVKKILKTLAISFLGAYVPFLVSFTIFFMLGIEPLLGSDLPNYIGEVMFISIAPFICAPFIIAVLYIFYLIDKRFLDKWLVFGFSFYCSAVVCILLVLENKNIWFLNSIWHFLGIILIPLITLVFLMNIKNWIKNPTFKYSNGNN